MELLGDVTNIPGVEKPNKPDDSPAAQCPGDAINILREDDSLSDSDEVNYLLVCCVHSTTQSTFLNINLNDDNTRYLLTLLIPAFHYSSAVCNSIVWFTKL